MAAACKFLAVTRSRPSRPLIALVAAYAIALQAMLAGAMLGARSGEAALLAGGSLCLSDRSHEGGTPTETMPCCVAAVCCPACGAPATLPQVAAFGLLPLPQTLPLDAQGLAQPDTGIGRRQQPRAPPAA